MIVSCERKADVTPLVNEPPKATQSPMAKQHVGRAAKTFPS